MSFRDPTPDLPPALEKTSAFRAHAQDQHQLQKLHGDFRDKLPHIFNPPEEKLPQVLAELCDPETSLADVACIFDTTVHAVSVWMTRPDIARQLTDHHNAAIVKARSAAACQLPKAVRALTNIVEEFNEESNRLLWNPRELSHIHARIRSRECTRRAATLLTRLARLVPPTSTVPSRSRCASPAASAPREVLPPGEGVEVAAATATEGATAVLPPLQRLNSPTAPDPRPNPCHWLPPGGNQCDTPAPLDTGSPRRRCEPVARISDEQSTPSPNPTASPRLRVNASSAPLTIPNSPIASQPSATGDSPLATAPSPDTG